MARKKKYDEQLNVVDTVIPVDTQPAVAQTAKVELTDNEKVYNDLIKAGKTKEAYEFLMRVRHGVV